MKLYGTILKYLEHANDFLQTYVFSTAQRDLINPVNFHMYTDCYTVYNENVIIGIYIGIHSTIFSTLTLVRRRGGGCTNPP